MLLIFVFILCYLFGYAISKIDFSLMLVECEVIYVSICSCKSELNNKFECKSHDWSQKLLIIAQV
jgi:hypothetical protein